MVFPTPYKMVYESPFCIAKYGNRLPNMAMNPSIIQAFLPDMVIGY